MSSRQPTDQQVGAIIHRIARVYLEVERGMRPPQHLEQLVTRLEYSRHRQQPAQDRLAATGPVVPSDIGRVRFDRDRRGNITAAVPTREVEDRWGSLVIHLTRSREGWTADYIQRIPRRGLTHDEDAPEPEAEELATRIRRIDSEGRLVKSALIAVERRLRDLYSEERPDPASVADLEERAEQWTRILDGIGQELDGLRRREKLVAAQEAREGDGSDSPDIEQVVDAKLAEMLGPKPDGHLQERLEEVRRDIVSYRERWGITRSTTLLGPESTDADQQREREQVARRLLEAARAMRSEPTPAAEPDRRSGLELERGLGRGD